MVAVHLLLAAHRPRTRIAVLILGVLGLFLSASLYHFKVQQNAHEMAIALGAMSGRSKVRIV